MAYGNGNNGPSWWSYFPLQFSVTIDVKNVTFKINRNVSVRFGSVRYGTVRYGSVRYGTVRYGSERYGSLRYGDDIVINSVEILYNSRINCKILGSR